MQEFNIFKVDEDKKKKGVWIDHPSGRFLIGSPDPIDVAKALEVNVKVIQKAHSSKGDPFGLNYEMSASEQMLMNAKVIVEFQLLGWEIEGVKYTKKRAVEAIMADREYTDSIKDEDEGDESEYQSLMDFVTQESSRLSNYETAAKEEDAKK